ncbi:crotonase/enoyl-CoA hydratase family protein [Pararhizobium mangrovi]|uniref:Crotonase/enoyl-CoA hydratase family protein n=1 Tax=Pararhizobium mangrovi TaxID=2590452 RepID=A0A506UA32_9HYPH|nr:crotonase/enoyl-CoA hydratase family protein [Pararhizobium mangrovi]TPW30216.1 crotonase/enoyl-CoA hydratase family protein [Pararhizobium mangrovi]
MTETKDLSIEEDGEIGIVRLDRQAKRNAISQAMIAEIGQLFAAPPEHWKAAILCGAGPHFSAGLDLREHGTRSVDAVMDLSRLWHRTTEAMLNGRLPIVAALNGYVIGGGLELAAATHIRIADRSVRYSLPEGRRGIFVGGGASVRVGRMIGTSRLTELMLTGREVDAEEGQQIGLSHRLVEPERAFETALEVARTVAANAPQSNRMILHGLAQIGEMPPSAGLFAESVMVALTQADPEAQERLDAFLTKRTR